MKKALILVLVVLLSMTYGAAMVGAEDITRVYEVIRIDVPAEPCVDLVNPVPEDQFLVIENITCQGHVVRADKNHGGQMSQYENY